MLSLFSLNPLNAIACHRTKNPVAILLAMGLTRIREICVSIVLAIQSRAFLSSLSEDCSDRHQMIWPMPVFMMFSVTFSPAIMFGLGFGILGFGTLGFGTLDCVHGDHAQQQYEQDAFSRITDELNIRWSLEYLLNPAFKSNSNVDSDPRQLTSGRYGLTPIPA